LRSDEPAHQISGEKPGVYPVARRGVDLKYLSFTIVELGGNLKEHSFESHEEEICLDFYSGPVRVEAEGRRGDGARTSQGVRR